eukprot:SM000614S19857  [mRNA]  locus=s614:2:1649:- [translate_table: standard]
MNSAAYQPDIQLRAVVQAYADVLMDPTVGDPTSPSIVVPTLKFADVEKDVMFGLSLLTAQDNDVSVDAVLDAVHNAEADLQESLAAGFASIISLQIGVHQEDLQDAVDAAKKALAVAKSTLAALQGQATSLQNQLTTARATGTQLHDAGQAQYQQYQAALADAQFWDSLTAIFKVVTSVASIFSNPSAAVGGLLGTIQDVVEHGLDSLAGQLQTFTQNMAQAIVGVVDHLKDNFLSDPVGTLRDILGKVEALQGLDLKDIGDELQKLTGIALPTDLASLEGDVAKAAGKVGDLVAQAVGIQNGSAVAVASFVSAAASVESWSKGVDTQFNGQCGASKGGVKSACEAYQGTLQQQAISNKLQLSLSHDLSAIHEQSAKATMQVLGTQQTVTDLMQQGIRWQKVLNDAAAQTKTVEEQVEEARRAASLITMQKGHARNLARMQIGIQLMTKMVQYCQLLRYAYPAYGDIVDPPLCGLLQGGKFNLAFRADQNLAQAAIALFDLREGAA